MQGVRYVWLVLSLLLLLGCRRSYGVAGELLPLPTTTPATVADLSTAAPTTTLASTEIAIPIAETPTTEVATAQPLPTATAAPATESSSPRPKPESGSVNDGDPWEVAAAPGVPVELTAALAALAEAQPEWFEMVDPDEAQALLVVGEGEPLAQWVYAAAVPFSTVGDEVELAVLQASWQGEGNLQMLAAPETAVTFAEFWGGEPPAEAIVPPEQTLWLETWNRPNSWAMVPFHQLRPELKVLRVAGLSPLEGGLDEAAYPLAVMIGVEGDEAAVEALRAAWTGPTTNRDEDRMTKVAMTGVTALVRATAYNMEQNGITWPGEEVAPVLQAADFAHISNEVSFDPECPFPRPVGGTGFCSYERYMPLLEFIGTDIVELTGNHLTDWGANNLVNTIAMYEAAGMETFGGGVTIAEAREPLRLEHNGNKLAFVGCNPVGPAHAWANEEQAGSNPCDYEALGAQIAELDAEGFVVIATQQYWEDYRYTPGAQQRADFRALAEAGAAAVSGSQGHHAQGFDFADGSFIHFGLGNLFFDQMDMLGTRQTFIDTYTIYDGRLISVELWTGLIEDYARPRQMTPEERFQFLHTVIEASGWTPR